MADDLIEGEDPDIKLRLAAAVFTNTQEGVVITDAEGRVVAINPAFSTMTGYTLDEMRGQTMRSLQSGRQGPGFYQDMWREIRNNGYWQGEIWNRRKNGEMYPALLTISSVRDERGKITNYVGSSTDLSRIKKSELQLERLTHYDQLTDLPNRHLLTLRLERAIVRTRTSSRTGAVIFLDLDGFKNVNDSLGHSFGDELLIHVARRIRHSVRGTDTLARFGGDEFVLLLENLPVAKVAPIVERILGRLAEPFRLSQGQEIFIRASAGIGLFPGDGTNASELIQHADAALYHAKSGGKATYRFYSAQLTQSANTRLSFEARMRRALACEELVLHYQPIVSLADSRIIGVEALVRWNDPEKGLLAPSEFVPLAEETGLIVPMGEWVLRTACHQMQLWRTQGISLDHIAVNISARQLQRPDFVRAISELLTDSDLPGDCLELEITEGALIGPDRATLSKLASLKALGIRIAIDDFGTGYSSLAYLKQLPIDKLKIDRSFVVDIPNDPACMEIASAIIGLARSLHLEVVAEGVDNPGQLEFLLKRGCATGQGYLFSTPVPGCALPALSRALRTADEPSQRVAQRVA
jgi:diguanylate cyclase (GGDEF)-like protein/PAS domain S-box-containing protein